VGVYLDWFGPATAVAHRLAPATPWLARLPGAATGMARFADLVGRRFTEVPTTQGQVRTHVLAEVRDAAGHRISRVQLAGPDPYAMTADLLAEAAVVAARGRVPGVGALGPVQALGLDGLTAVAATAGLTRT
jgi:hypothetical protein